MLALCAFGVTAAALIGGLIIGARIDVLAQTVETLNSRLTLYRNTLYLTQDYFFT